MRMINLITLKCGDICEFNAAKQMRCNIMITTHTQTDRQRERQKDRQTSIMDTESMMILTSSLTAQHHLKLILHTDTHTDTQTVH